MPLDIYAALGALVRAEATRETDPACAPRTADTPCHTEREAPTADGHPVSAADAGE
jgi:hypothetical protein